MPWPRLTARFATAITADLRRPSPRPLARTTPCSTPPLPPPSPSAGLRHLFWPSRAAMAPPPPPPTTTLALAACEGASSWSSSHHDPRRGPLDLALLLAAGGGAAVAVLATPRTAKAASGGVMGGRETSPSPSSSSSSSSSPSWSHSSSPYRSSSPYYPSSSSPSSRRSSSSSQPSSSPTPPLSPAMIQMIQGLMSLAFIGAIASVIVYCCTRPRTTVVKLQVALQGLAKTMQRDLNAVAAKVDTTKKRRYKFMLTETICSLVRHKYYHVSSSLSADVKKTVDAVDSWEEHFDKISIEERSKTDEETLFNVDGVKINKKYSQEPDGCRKGYIVLIIILAAEGKPKFPKIRSAADLQLVLGMLNGIHASEIKGIQILWTPQEEDDILSEERLLKDYPYLKPLKQLLLGESKQRQSLLGAREFLLGESKLLLGEPKGPPLVQKDPNTKGC